MLLSLLPVRRGGKKDWLSGPLIMLAVFLMQCRWSIGEGGEVDGYASGLRDRLTASVILQFLRPY